MQLFPYLSPAVSDASAKTKHHSFQHLISGKFGTLGDGWPWSFMEKMSNWQEVCKLRWQTALIVPQPKWVLCTCWVCLEPHFLPETMSWPASHLRYTPHIPWLALDFLNLYCLEWGSFSASSRAFRVGGEQLPFCFCGVLTHFLQILVHLQPAGAPWSPLPRTGRCFWSSGAFC